jgi:hypothetical protein
MKLQMRIFRKSRVYMASPVYPVRLVLAVDLELQGQLPGPAPGQSTIIVACPDCDSKKERALSHALATA